MIIIIVNECSKKRNPHRALGKTWCIF